MSPLEQLRPPMTSQIFVNNVQQMYQQNQNFNMMNQTFKKERNGLSQIFPFMENNLVEQGEKANSHIQVNSQRHQSNQIHLQPLFNKNEPSLTNYHEIAKALLRPTSNAPALQPAQDKQESEENDSSSESISWHDKDSPASLQDNNQKKNATN